VTVLLLIVFVLCFVGSSFFGENKECFYIVTPFSGYATNI